LAGQAFGLPRYSLNTHVRNYGDVFVAQPSALSFQPSAFSRRRGPIADR
jgi:hypothetical protein